MKHTEREWQDTVIADHDMQVQTHRVLHMPRSRAHELVPHVTPQAPTTVWDDVKRFYSGLKFDPIRAVVWVGVLTGACLTAAGIAGLLGLVVGGVR